MRQDMGKSPNWVLKQSKCYYDKFDFMFEVITQSENVSPLFFKIVFWFLLLFIVCLVVYKFADFIESMWVMNISPKPFFRHFYIVQRKLLPDQIYILESQFTFYQSLNPKEQKYFRHRVATFIKSNKFFGKSGVLIDDQKKVLVAATSVMLTFGYRKYKLHVIDKIIIYPSVYYSKINRVKHKGEFNPNYSAIIFSWEDFKTGYDVSNDNFNLGIHEFVHAMHYQFMHPNNESVNAIIFINNFEKLKRFLEHNDAYKERLIKSNYLRDYAFTNNWEFIAVLIESFMETPQDLKTQFPEMYAYVRKMLNFNFSGY